MRQLWDDGRFAGRNIYEGQKNAEGKVITGTALANLTYGARGLMVYEAIERALGQKINAIYSAVGRPQDASIGRYHWESWVAFSQQEASHGSLGAVLSGEIHSVTAKQGEYGSYEYGARYSRDASGMPQFSYTTPSGKEYVFSVPAFRNFLEDIKKPASGVVPTKFRVTEAGNAPWYERPGVNKGRLDNIASKWADRSVDGRRVPEAHAGTEATGGLGGQSALLQVTKGAINNPAVVGRRVIYNPAVRPLVTLFKDADFSTLVHESAHGYLGMLSHYAEHPNAPPELLDDWLAVKDWLGVRDASEIGRKQHEQFSRGFEQYLREGRAPTRALARAFAAFKYWMTSIYDTLKGLGKPINDEARQIFDRMLAENPEPTRTVLASDWPRRPTLQDIHRANAREAPTGPPATPIAEEIEGDAIRHDQAAQTTVQAEVAGADARRAVARAETGERAAAEGQMAGLGGGPANESAGDTARGAPGAELGGGSAGAAQGANAAERGRSAESRNSTGNALAPAGMAPRLDTRNPRPDLVDKAGNIRPENLTDADDVRTALHITADENGEFMAARRISGEKPTLSDQDVEDLADAMGMTGAGLKRLWNGAGTAFNAEQIIAARKLLINSATTLSDLMKKAANGTDQDVLAYAEWKAKHRMIQEVVSGVTAEAGRALRAFRDISGSAEAMAADQFARQATGKTLWQLKEEAKLFQQLKTPQNVTKFVKDSAEMSFGKMLIEYWINGLISGIPTHVTYIIGNSLLTANNLLLETPAAAAIGALQKARGRQGNVIPFGEVGARLRGAAQGAPVMAEAMLEAARTGDTGLLRGEKVVPGSFTQNGRVIRDDATWRDAQQTAFSLGRGMKDGIVAWGELVAAGGDPNAPIVGWQPTRGAIGNVQVKGVTVPTPFTMGEMARGPSRFIATIHTGFRAINSQIEASGIAYRKGLAEAQADPGWASMTHEQRESLLASRVGFHRANPTPDDIAQIHKASNEATLMAQGGKWTQNLSRVLNTEFAPFGIESLRAPYAKFIDPFVHISSNIIDQAIMQRTPLGILKGAIRDDLMGKNGTIAADRAAARMLVGTVLAATFGLLAAEGYVTGAGPSDRKQQDQWRLAGYQAHSVRIGDTWIDLHRLGPLGMLLGMAADIWDVGHIAETEDYSKVTAAFWFAITQSVLDESFMRGPSQLIQALDDPKRYGATYVRNLASTFVPYSVGMSYTARSMDPHEREVRTILDAIKAKIPGERETLMPKIDLWGQPIAARAALGGPATAIWETQLSHDPVNMEMERLRQLDGFAKGPVDRKIRNQTLTDDQYQEFAQLAGRLTKQSLDRVINSPMWRQIPDGTKEQMIDEIFKQSREGASGLIMMRHPSIPAAAVEQKRARLR
jgi:hypothetical protein